MSHMTKQGAMLVEAISCKLEPHFRPAIWRKMVLQQLTPYTNWYTAGKAKCQAMARTAPLGYICHTTGISLWSTYNHKVQAVLCTGNVNTG